MNTPLNREPDRPLRTSDLASAGTPSKDRAEEETRMDRTQENRIERATEVDESRGRREARETNRAEREASAKEREERKATAAKRATESEGMRSVDDPAL